MDKSTLQENSNSLILKEWSTLTGLEQKEFSEKLIADYDTVTSDCETGEDFLQNMKAIKTVFWAMFYKEHFIGVSGLSPVQRIPGYIQCTSYILSNFRGIGFSIALKRAYALTLKKSGIKFGIAVRDWNTVSQKAVEKSFPGITFERVPHLIDDRFWYDLETYDLSLIPQTENNLTEAIEAKTSFLKTSLETFVKSLKENENRR